MKIIKIVGEHKSKLRGGRKSNRKIKRGHIRVEAIIEEDGLRMTRHIDIPKK